MLCTSDFVDDVTLGRNGRDAERWRRPSVTAINDVPILRQSLMCTNACCSVISLWLIGLMSILSPHADRHAGDISLTVSLCVYLCLCLRIFCNGYLRRGLTQGDENWQNGRPR